MAGAALFPFGDNWLAEYEACERLSREILEKINERSRLQRNGGAQSQLNVSIRQMLKTFSADVSTLRHSLLEMSASNDITVREAERRQVMFDNLASKEKQLMDSFNNRSADGSGRSTLLGDNYSGFSTVGWNDTEETDETRGLTNDDLRMQHQQAVIEQDQGLEVLSSVIARQKQMAYAIGDEVDVQNELIDDITDHVDRTRERLVKETRHVRIIDRKSNTCVYWVIIILLLVAIIVIAAVPHSR